MLAHLGPLPYLVLLQVGFTMPALLPRTRCALTAPFHPYRLLQLAPQQLRRFALCCTFRRLAPPRRYLAPDPPEPGLSSTLDGDASLAATARPAPHAHDSSPGPAVRRSSRAGRAATRTSHSHKPPTQASHTSHPPVTAPSKPASLPRPHCTAREARTASRTLVRSSALSTCGTTIGAPVWARNNGVSR